MTDSDRQYVETEASEDTKNVLVVDPEDYQKTQKLKSIQEAKDHFKSFTLNEREKFEKLSETWGNPEEALKHKEAKALSMYGSELIPLIERGIEEGGLSEDDLEVELDNVAKSITGKKNMSIRTIVKLEGRIHNGDNMRPLPSHTQMRVYRQLERIERKLGLGPDIEVDNGPAQI